MRIVVLACGNPARGDDALGPAFASEAAKIAVRSSHRIEIETDFQLAPEHALDLANCDAALFVDASVNGSAPFEFARVRPGRDRTFTSHAMSPAAVLGAHVAAFGPPPPAFALAIRGSRFDLGAPMTAAARGHLAAALALFGTLLADASPRAWARLASGLREAA